MIPKVAEVTKGIVPLFSIKMMLRQKSQSLTNQSLRALIMHSPTIQESLDNKTFKRKYIPKTN